MIKHTPGPWEADNNEGYSIWTIRSLTGIVATVHGDSPETDCNAWLIAAAPEMYELIDDLSRAYDHDKPSHDLAATLYDLRCKALQLLAKIEGGEA